MNWILGFTFILVVILLFKNYFRKKKLSKLKEKLLRNWGKPKDKEHFNFHVIGQYFENYNDKDQLYHTISDRTSNDLDLDELFKYIDRTSSKIGQQYLYFKIKTIGTLEKLKNFDLLGKLFLDNGILRLKSQLILSRINSNSGYDLEKLINDEPIEKPKYLILIYASSITSFVLVILAFFNPIFSLLLLPIFLINTIFHYRNKENVTYYISGVNELSKALKVSKELASFDEIKQHFTDLSFIKKVNTIQTKTEFVGFEKQLSNEYVLFFWLIIELLKIQFMIEYIVFYSFVASLKMKRIVLINYSGLLEKLMQLYQLLL